MASTSVPPPEKLSPFSAASGDHDPLLFWTRPAFTAAHDEPRFTHRGCPDSTTVVVPFGFANVCEYAVRSAKISTRECCRRAALIAASAAGSDAARTEATAWTVPERAGTACAGVCRKQLRPRHQDECTARHHRTT